MIALKQVVAALIVRGSEVLICQRTESQPMPLQWEFPGGKVEPGEETKAALARELDEELGINASIGPEVASIRHVYRSGNGVELHFFLVERYEGELQNRIFRQVIWTDRESLTKFDFLEADKSLVAEIAVGKII